MPRFFHPLNYLVLATIFIAFYIVLRMAGAADHIVIVSLTPLEGGGQPSIFLAMLFVIAHNLLYVAVPVLVTGAGIFALANRIVFRKRENDEPLSEK
ncbi:MAG: hypothetical protein E3J72_12870 [Planctomycetota bacterium]|nr:MAG: hypothetical protein E3J72_12870 [Planctomycetota bacterium]